MEISMMQKAAAVMAFKRLFANMCKDCKRMLIDTVSSANHGHEVDPKPLVPKIREQLCQTCKGRLEKEMAAIKGG